MFFAVLLLAMLLQAKPISTVYLPLLLMSGHSVTPTVTPSLTPTLVPTPTATPQPGSLRIGYLECETATEYVRIDNVGGAVMSLAGWRILSVVGTQVFYFPDYGLAPGASVYVYSGPGQPPTGDDRLFWTAMYIWNNAGDEARLVEPSGLVIDSRTC